MSRGAVEQAIRSTIRTGAVLTTPARGARFTVAAIDERGVVLLLGEKEAHTRLSWEALEGVADLLAGRGWVPIGSSYTTTAAEGTLDAYLKRHINRATAGWVAALLEKAGVVEVDRRAPARVRSTSGAGHRG
jgi:hypothetical protein